MADNTYNGWPNYQTWNVMLWMDNDEPAYRLYRDHVRQAERIGVRFTGWRAKTACAEAFGFGTPDGVSFDDSRIRWAKIAEAMREN